MTYRNKAITCLGKFPEKTAVKPKITDTIDKGTHIQQTISYNVEADERINAYLLVPKALNNKNPAIIACHQHAGMYSLGKSELAGQSTDSMYHYGLELCMRGYVVLCPDHLCFEDRRPSKEERMQNSCLDKADYERLMFCKYILEGSTLQAKYLSDLCRGLDLLETLDFVDKEKIGAIGHSLGGQETLWLSWYDSRIKAAVSSCGFGQLHTIIRDGINHNFAAYCPGFLNIGDIADLVCDNSPMPFMMTNGSDDGLFPIDGVKEIAKLASDKYKEHGYEDRFKSIIFDGEHSFPPEIRIKAYEWLDRFLK